MTIENNFITNDKIDTCPAFYLIYLLQSLQMLTNTHYQWQWVYEAYPILCSLPFQPLLDFPVQYTVQLFKLTQFLHKAMFFRNQNVH